VGNLFVTAVLESTKHLVTMERAALFKKKNDGKLISDIFIVNVSNHNRICGHLVQVFFKTMLKQPND